MKAERLQRAATKLASSLRDLLHEIKLVIKPTLTWRKEEREVLIAIYLQYTFLPKEWKMWTEICLSGSQGMQQNT